MILTMTNSVMTNLEMSKRSFVTDGGLTIPSCDGKLKLLTNKTTTTFIMSMAWILIVNIARVVVEGTRVKC